jgi:hypothetical protein
MTLHSEKALEMLVENMSIKDFRKKLMQKEYAEIMHMILPSLCNSSSFISNVTRSKDKSFIVKVILEQSSSTDEECALSGLN